jgi:tripartite-type tricarboxylate transporter receptor subunit TctC
MSPEIVDTLHKTFKKSLEDPEFIRVVNQVDAIITYRGPEDLAKHLVEMNEFFESMIVKLGLRKG